MPAPKGIRGRINQQFHLNEVFTVDANTCEHGVKYSMYCRMCWTQSLNHASLGDRFYFGKSGKHRKYYL